MAGYSARQSSFTTGDTILAAHSNDEFNQVLAAFHATTGHSHDGTAGEGGPISTLRDADSLNKILVDTSNNHLEFYVEVSSAAVQQLRIQDGAIVPITDNDIDLGTSSLEFKDLYVDGTAHVDAINFNGTVITSTAAELNILDGVTSTATELNIMDGDTSASSTTVVDADRVVLNDDGTMKQVAVTDLAAYFDDEITAMPNLTSVGTLTTLTVDNIIINGTNIGHTSDTDALAIDSSGNVTASQNLTVTGDLTVSGDDITMGTNTAGNLLIADGTNFNSVAVGSLSEISTVAGDDVLLAVDTSGGGLKKITRSTLTAGLVSGSEISNVVEDSTPQLGGNLDMNGNDIVTTSNADIDLAPNGTGKVVVKGNTNPGTVVFNCESNSHGQTVKSQPHSASVTNVLTLPAGGDQEIVGTSATQTLTNKTLTTPTIAEIDSGSTITLDATTDIVLDAGGADVIFKDDGTSILTITNNSTDVDFTVATQDKDINFKGDDGGSGITALSLDMSDAGTAVFNHDIKIADDGQIGSASDPDAMTISSSGVVTFSQAPVFPDGVVPLVDLDIDGGTDIGADLTTSDLIIVDDGAGGTNRKAALSRVVTLMTAQGFTTDDPTALAIALG